MKGFSLLEFLIASSLFLIILVFGYQSLDRQGQLTRALLGSTRPEEESNYRWLVLKNFLQDSTQKFKSDSRLAEVPYFFPDLVFGQQPRNDAFSVARPLSDPLQFTHDGTAYSLFPGFSFQRGEMVALAGLNIAGKFDWNYGYVALVYSTQKIKLDLILNRTQLISGSMQKVEINGFLFKNKTLYWVAPSGQLQPFFALDSFIYRWSVPQLTIYWRAGKIDSTFVASL